MCLHSSKTPETAPDWFEALYNLARYLRGPEGCPWDRAHTAVEFAADVCGEARELEEALSSGDNAHAAEEFGDAFFVLMAAAAAAEQEGRFELKDALERAHAKMIRRHSHVFGPNKALTPDEAIQSWNLTKEEERKRK